MVETIFKIGPYVARKSLSALALKESVAFASAKGTEFE